LPLSSEARADQGCRKRRNQVPDWSEITCRFPPKSPAAFDRNQVPVCSDFCIHLLYQYANEAAWREDNRRKPNVVIGAALARPKSPVWTGYWHRSAS